MEIVEHPLDFKAFFNPSHLQPGDQQAAFPKDLIVLHFTAGPNAYGAWAQFQQNPKTLGYPVSTAFLVEGAVPYGGLQHNKPFVCWRLFPAIYWSYHLGISGVYAQAHKHDKRSVGIEIASIGPLVVGQDLDTLLWGNIPAGSHFPSTAFCKITELEYISSDETARHFVTPVGDKVMKLTVPFRDREWFVEMPKEQCVAAARLVAQLCQDLKIPKVLAPPQKRFEADLPFFSTFKGVATHVNFVPAGKWDQSPVHSDGLFDELDALGFASL